MTADLPAHLRAVLPASAQTVWRALAGNLPIGAYLVGGTGIAAHLGHRVSRDLDFFVPQPFDPTRLASRLEQLGSFAATQLEPGTLNGYLNDTKLQFLDTHQQHPIEPTAVIGGIPVAGLGDLLATKLEVIGDRGELRDYFDLLALERDAGRRVEEGLALFLERYRTATPDAAVLHIVRGLGYFADVADDPALPMSRTDIENHWTRRQPEVVRALDRLGLTNQPPPSRGPELAT
ncbi:MAG: nucleotidyl transferase AbiEii/AbiGii toxin family protein [Acidimicrobiales bacterium]